MPTKAPPQRLGLVLGRFQPLHTGHVRLMRQAFRENDRVVICIGSAQRAEPLSIRERHRRVLERLRGLGHARRHFRIVDLVDPEPMAIWPQYVKEVCRITDRTRNTFYRADALPKRYVRALEHLGFTVRIVPRKSFSYRAPDGTRHTVSSATQIRKIHEKAGEEDSL